VAVPLLQRRDGAGARGVDGRVGHPAAGAADLPGVRRCLARQGQRRPGRRLHEHTPKLVASTTLDAVDWHNSRLLAGDLAEELSELKRQPGKNINVTGSVTLVRWLLREHLLDELGLMVCPIVVGRGKRLFEQAGGQQPLRLLDASTFGTGVVSLGYAPT
jgi:dihydrofolate reductase